MAPFRRLAFALGLLALPLASAPFDGLLSTNRIVAGETLTAAFPFLTRAWQIQWYSLDGRLLGTHTFGAEERRDRLYVTVRVPAAALPGPVWVRLKTDRYDRRVKILIDAP
jgi:hypothetical protein